jgi:hypothetical protein
MNIEPGRMWRLAIPSVPLPVFKGSGQRRFASLPG